MLCLTSVLFPIIELSPMITFPLTQAPFLSQQFLPIQAGPLIIAPCQMTVPYPITTLSSMQTDPTQVPLFLCSFGTSAMMRWRQSDSLDNAYQGQVVPANSSAWGQSSRLRSALVDSSSKNCLESPSVGYSMVQKWFSWLFILWQNTGYKDNLMTTMKLLFIVLAFSVSTHQSDSCQQLVKSWMEAPQTLPPISYADSGKFLNDLGDYNNCLYHSDQYVYFTLSVINRLAQAIQNIGLCAPIECQEDLASNAYAPQIQLYLNTAFQNATNSTYSPFVNLHFYQPINSQPQMNWTNYLTIGLFLLLITLGVVGSFISKITSNQSKPIRIIKSFSFYDNLAKIITIPTKHDNENLLFLNGARVLSICWIIYGHDQWFRLSNIKNWTEGLDILTTPGITTLAPAAYFAVDTFFWIGGLLVTMGMLQQFKKIKSFTKFYFGAVLHRFIRIWPTYMLAILIFWKIAPYLGDGPIWRNYYTISCSCNDGGVLWNMFFIDNFEDHGPNGMDYCFGWGWYLAVDFQLFLITPFILYAYHKNKKLGWLISFILFLASVLTAFILIMVNDWRYPIPNPKFAPQPEFMDQFYYKPYIRASAYIMGIFTGFIYVEWKNNNEAYVNLINKIKNSVIIRAIFYIVGIGLVEAMIWVIVPYQRGEYWSTFTQAIYNSLNRVFFILGVFLCCFSSLFGCKHDPTKYILGHWLFSPLAKVSFCMYLTHLIVILDGTFSVRMELFWQVESSLYVVIADIFFSILLATCLSLLIESPVLGLEKIFLRGEKPKEKVKSLGTGEQQLRESLIESKQKQESVQTRSVNQQISMPFKVSPQENETLLL